MRSQTRSAAPAHDVVVAAAAMPENLYANTGTVTYTSPVAGAMNYSAGSILPNRTS